MPGPLYKDGHLGKVTWTDPSNYEIARGVLAVIFIPLLVAALAAFVIVKG